MDHEVEVEVPPGSLRSTSAIELAIAALAARQHGVVEHGQLRRIGLSAKAIKLRVKSGRLHPIHRGVYSVGHRLISRHGRWKAATLAAGPDAVLSGTHAGALWRILKPSMTSIELRTPTKGQRRPGLTIRHAHLPADERTIHHGIPTATVPRTLLDIAATQPPYVLEKAAKEAEVQRLSDPLSLGDLVERYPGRRGVAHVRALLRSGRLAEHVTDSELLDAFLAFLDERGLERPEINATIRLRGEQKEVDCLYRRQRVIVELDGRRFHGHAVAFEEDRRRDRGATAAGYTPIRVTWRDLHLRPDELEADLRPLL